MWRNTELSRRFGLAAPIIQGPFGSGLSAVDLVVAVCEAGALGSFGVHHLDADGIRDVATQIRLRTKRPFALNLWIPLGDSDDPQMSDQQFVAYRELLRPYFEELRVPLPTRPDRFGPRYAEQVESVLDVRPAVFSFVYGVPSPDVIDRCRELGIATLCTATTPLEARLLESSGVDMIVATGFEAGGHRASFLKSAEECLTGTLSLVPQVVDTVRIPVIAAGGIADGRGVAAALLLGAQGVQIGTAFLACEESAAGSLHRERLLGSEPTQTALTKSFTGRLARAIRNQFMDDMASHESAIAPYPVQRWLTAHLRGAALKAGRSDLVAMWSGQSAPLLRHRKAGQLVDALITQTTAAVRRFC